MVQRYSSREEAKAQAISQQQQADMPYSPKGRAFDNFAEIRRWMMNYAGMWVYRSPDVIEGTAVVMHRPTPTTKTYEILSQYKGLWYRDYPEPPFLLYQRYEWINAETVYVCEGEPTSDAVEKLGLPATASLGGVTRAKLSDWTPLKGKNVVILSDYDDKGLNYAREVAQLCLGIGALSARIVKFSGLKVGEGPREWIDNVRASSGDEAILPELQKLVDAAVPEVYVPPVPEPPKGLQLELQTLADIAPAPQKWVFDKVIPQGNLTVLMGESGVGKSLTILDIAAKVTRGLTGPHDDQPQEPGTVLFLSAQDGLGETIRPRLEASNADLTKVSVIPGFRERDDVTNQELAWTFQLERDMSFLEDKLKSLQQAGVNVRMLVIDPIDRFLEPAPVKKKISTHTLAGRVAQWNPGMMQEEVQPSKKKIDIEKLSARLAKLASDMKVAIVVTTQLPRSVKGTSKLVQSMRRAIDMGPFLAEARSVWMVGQDLEHQNRRLLLPVKTNLCERPKSMAYQFANGVIEWEKEPPTLTSDEYQAKCEDYIQGQRRAAREAKSQLSFALRWLKGELSEGPLPAKTVRRDAADNSISNATLRRAAAELRVESLKYAFAGPWNWRLPEPAVESPEEKQAEAESVNEGAQGDVSEGVHDGHHEDVQRGGYEGAHDDGLDIGFKRADEDDEEPRPWPKGEIRRR
jgi:putative DNA primase/helicase